MTWGETIVAGPATPVVVWKSEDGSALEVDHQDRLWVYGPGRQQLAYIPINNILHATVRASGGSAEQREITELRAEVGRLKSKIIDYDIEGRIAAERAAPPAPATAVHGDLRDVSDELRRGEAGPWSRILATDEVPVCGCRRAVRQRCWYEHWYEHSGEPQLTECLGCGTVALWQESVA